MNTRSLTCAFWFAIAGTAAFAQPGAPASNVVLLSPDRVFTALAEDRRGNVDAEIAAYRQASDIAPGCQTPLVGMTAVRRLQGSTAEAAALARTLTEGPDNSCDDAWWYYRFGPSPDRIPEKLEQLRALENGHKIAVFTSEASAAYGVGAVRSRLRRLPSNRSPRP